MIMRDIINAIRNLGRRGQHNVVKILCLAVGLALGSVMIAEVWYEKNYDTWFEGHERTYRVYLSYSMNGQEGESRFTSGATAMGLRKYCPQVEAATRWCELLGKGQFIAAGDKRIMERCRVADSCLFDVFPQTIIAGDVKKTLSQPFYCAVSRDLAERLGGVEEALGTRITSRDFPKVSLTIGAVYEDFPLSSDLRNEHIFCSMATWNKVNDWDSPNNWVGNECYHAYVRLREGAKPDDIKIGVKKMIEENIDQNMLKEAGIELDYYLVKANEVHMDSDFAKTMVMLLSVLSAVLLFSMVMNYLLIIIGNVLMRSREMAVRKCFGAGNGNILSITFSETLVHLIIASVLATLLIYVCKGSIEQLLGAPVEVVVLNRGTWLLAAILLAIIVVGGMVPAWLYSHVPVTSAFRGYHTSRRRWKLGLLAFQFVASATLVAMLVVIHRQYTMMMDRYMGYDYDRLAIVEVNGGQQDENYSKCEEELARQPEVEMVSSCTCLPLDYASGNYVMVPGDSRSLFNLADLYFVGNGYIKLMNMKIIDGKGFTENSDSTMREVMVSRYFVEKMDSILHWKGSAVGKKVFISEHSQELNDLFTICGVYENIHIGNITDPDTRPSVMFYNRKNNPYILVRLHHLDEASMKAVRRTVERLCPGREVQVVTYPSLVADSYQDVDSLRKVVMAAGVVTFLIALIGLVGYTIDEVNRRRKEIAIRKVNGAKTKDILVIFVRSIMWIAVPSLIAGCIIAWQLSRQWLMAFSEKITLSPMVFIGCMIILLILVIAIIIANSYKIASGNPVKYLKDE